MKKLFTIVAIILSIITLTGCSFTKDEKVIENETKSNTVSKEIQTQIMERLSLMVLAENYTGGKYITNQELSEYIYPIFENSVSEEIKSFITLKNLELKRTKFDLDNIDFYDDEDEENYLGEYLLDNAEAVSKKEFDTMYKKIFGEEPNHVDVKLGCPYFLYDSKGEQYVDIPGCGGVAFVEDMLYVDNFEADGDKINVTIYVGSKYTNPEDGMVAYNDYFASKSAKKISADCITEEIKTKFTKYNFIFEKSIDNQYYLKEVKRIG